METKRKRRLRIASAALIALIAFLATPRRAGETNDQPASAKTEGREA